IARHFKFDLEVPFKKLAKKHQQILLRGSKEVIKFKYKDDDGQSYTKASHFEGVLPNLERRYRETESDFVREELRKYITSRACESCEGTRLGQPARNVLVTGKSLPDIAAWPVDKAKSFFDKLHLSGYRGDI